MRYEKAIELQNKIKKIASTECSEGALCFFGSGLFCMKMLKYFDKKELVKPVAICDNNKAKQGTVIDGIPVISFETALEKYKNLKILITSVEYGDEIRNQVIEKLEENNVVNIAPYFTPPTEETLFELQTKEWEDKVKRYVASLRGENDEKFTLLKPEDMPEEAKEIVRKLKYYRDAYERGENLLLEEDEYLIKTDYEVKGVNFFKDIFRDNYPENIKKPLNLIGFINQIKFNIINRNFFELEFKATIDINNAIKNVSNFSDYLKEKEIPFLYMQIPDKIPPEQIEKNEFIDTMNPAATEFLNGLKNNNINTLDYREFLPKTNKEFLEIFFETDFHWKTKPAFYATKKLCEEIQTLLNTNLDMSKFDLANYYQIIYPNIMLGNIGKKVGVLYTELDDYELILPKYETDYTWSVPLKGFEKRGNAKKALLYHIQLDWSYLHSYPYVVYNLVNGNHTIIKNNKEKYNRRILFLQDSFTIPMAIFLAPHFSEMHFIDLREELDKEYVFNIIKEVKPDIVVILYSAGTFTRDQKMTDINPYK